MTGGRVPTETGKPGNSKWSWKSQGTGKINKKSLNFVIGHGSLPFLSSDPEFY